MTHKFLGHRNLSSTQHYAKVSPTKLAKAYVDTGYLETLTHTVKVLIMQQEIPLTDEERSAVEDGTEAFERLLQKLEGMPTPAQTIPDHKQAAARPLLVLSSSFSASPSRKRQSSVEHAIEPKTVLEKKKGDRNDGNH